MKNYQGKKIIYDEKNLIEAKEEFKDFRNDLKNFKRNFGSIDSIKKKGRDDLFKLVQSLYGITDKVLAEFEEFIPCEKGCGECCQQLIPITGIEGRLIEEFISNNFSKEEIQKINSKIKKRIKISQDAQKIQNESENIAGYEQRRKVMKKSVLKQIPCIFLSEEGLCKIYSVRPWNCRFHIVFSSPQSCTVEAEEKQIRFDKIPFQAPKKLMNDVENELNKLNKNLLNGENYTLEGYFTTNFI